MKPYQEINYIHCGCTVLFGCGQFHLSQVFITELWGVFKSWVIFVLVFYNCEQTFQREIYSERHYFKFLLSFNGTS